MILFVLSSNNSILRLTNAVNRALLILCLLVASAANSTEFKVKPAKLKILVSINPLYLAINEAFADKVETGLILPPGISPHYYALKPSEALKIRQADLIVWIGPELEQFLIKPLQLRDSPPETVFETLTWLKTKQPEDLLRLNQLRPTIEEDHVHAHQHLEKQEFNEFGTAFDPHLWLSKNLIISIIKELQRRLIILQPELTASLETSVQNFIGHLLTKEDTSKLRNKKFISYHNGFDYLARDVGFSIEDVITSNPEIRPGASQVIRIKERFNEAKINQETICLITERQFSGGIAARITDPHSASAVELDPLGRGFTRYSTFLANMINKLTNCGEPNL